MRKSVNVDAGCPITNCGNRMIQGEVVLRFAPRLFILLRERDDEGRSFNLASATGVLCHVSTKMEEFRDAGGIAGNQKEMSFEFERALSVTVVCRDPLCE